LGRGDPLGPGPFPSRRLSEDRGRAAAVAARNPEPASSNVSGSLAASSVARTWHPVPDTSSRGGKARLGQIRPGTAGSWGGHLLDSCSAYASYASCSSCLTCSTCRAWTARYSSPERGGSLARSGFTNHIRLRRPRTYTAPHH